MVAAKRPVAKMKDVEIFMLQWGLLRRRRRGECVRSGAYVRMSSHGESTKTNLFKMVQRLGRRTELLCFGRTALQIMRRRNGWIVAGRDLV